MNYCILLLLLFTDCSGAPGITRSSRLSTLAPAVSSETTETSPQSCNEQCDENRNNEATRNIQTPFTVQIEEEDYEKCYFLNRFFRMEEFINESEYIKDTGAFNSADLAMARGASTYVNWADPGEVEKVKNLLICENHQKELIQQWESRKSYRHMRVNKVSDKQYVTCSIPEGPSGPYGGRGHSEGRIVDLKIGFTRQQAEAFLRQECYISLWLHQAAHGFTAHGGDTRAPHLVLLTNRIAKLVFFKRDRQLRRYVDEITINKQQKRALKEAVETGQSLGAVRLGIEDDLFALPDEPLKEFSPKKPATVNEDDFLVGYHDLVSRDERIAFLADVKQRMKKEKLNNRDIPEDPNDFASFQRQRVLQRVKVNTEIDALRNEKVHQSAKLKGEEVKVVVDAHSRGHLLIHEKSEKKEHGKTIEKPRIGNWNEFVKQIRKQFKDESEKKESDREVRKIGEEKEFLDDEYMEDSDQELQESERKEGVLDDGDVEEAGQIGEEKESVSDDDLEETMHMISSEKPASRKVDREFVDSGLSKSSAIENFMEKLNKKKANSPSLITIEDSSDSDSSDMEVIPLDVMESEGKASPKKKEMVQIDPEDGNELNFIEKDEEELVDNVREDEKNIYSECQQLLTLLGLPYIVAPGEAEAQCAELERLGLVEGIVTDDSDIWLFGGKKVYKNMFSRNRNVHFFDGNIIEEKIGLSKFDFIVLTMLAGGDYTRGLDNVGIVTGLELMAEFSKKGDTKEDGFEVLRDIKNWCGHCINYKPKWVEFATNLKDWSSVVQVTVINCADEKNSPVCREHEIDAFPTLKYFPPGSSSKDDGQKFTADKYNLDSMTLELVKLVHGDYTKSQPNSWPKLAPTESDVTLDKLWAEADSTKSMKDTKISPEPAQEVPINWDQYKVQNSDIISALRYMLYEEIPRKNIIEKENLSTLKSWMNVLKKYVPGTAPIRRLFYRLDEWTQIQTSIKAEEWINKINSLQEDLGNPLPKEPNWISCKGSKPFLRGYTCGLWTTMHAVTVQAYLEEKDNYNFKPVNDVLEPLHQFIYRYLSCQICSENFHKMATETNPLSLVTRKEDVILWFWRAHNSANKRLAKDASEDPQFPKRQFPPGPLCHDCQVNGIYLEDRVLDFMIKYYTDIRTDGILPDPGYKVTEFENGKIQKVANKHLNPKFNVHADKIDKLEEAEARMKNVDGYPKRTWKNIEAQEYGSVTPVTDRSTFYFIWMVIIVLGLVLAYSKYKQNRSKFWKYYYSEYKLDNSTFPDGSYKISAQSLNAGLPEQAPLVVDISMLNELGLNVDNSSLIAETNRLSYFFVRLPPDNTNNARVKRQVTDDDGSIGIQFGSSDTIIVIPLNLSTTANSGISLLGTLPDNSQVYQLEVRMADEMCSNSIAGSCSIVNWTPYSISSENTGSQSNFTNDLPVACGSQCNAAANSPCAISCSACDGQQVAGADTPVTRRYNMNTTAAKNILFSYETYTIKDRITVSYEGKNLFDSSCVGTEGEKYAPISFKGNSVEVRVDVEPNCEGTTGTAWYFTLPCANGCQGCQEYQCLDDSKAHCGPKGYLIDYGLYYCNRYYDYYNIFDADGQAFINCVRPSLLDYLKNYLNGVNGNVDCDDLESKAFDSHIQIYLNCNFCNVIRSNCIAFTEVLWHNFFHPTVWIQFIELMGKCGFSEICDVCPDLPCTCLNIPFICPL
ncbi:hypothetical protein FO519_008948 [Halicephalobus sp. NKZ332]|nr:hypothetical protein FO519_008948 [Halicephalobus sp. NKZ332]